jgi:hypothetical protein
MRAFIKNRRRTQLTVESLEGKTLLSTASAMHHLAHHATAAPIVTHATSAFTGTLTGPYSSVHVPSFAYIQSFATSGTLTGLGSTHLYGTLFVRPSAPAGKPVGQVVMHNSGGTMIVNVFSSATAGTYSYKVALAFGSDTAFKGDTGALTITLSPNFSVPYYTSGQSTMTFS